jgi:uncharacterized double-CXXCG motif protein
MERFYSLKRPAAPRHTGSYNASHTWGLPGVHCPQCQTTWAGACTGYPSVDLSSLAAKEDLTKPRVEPYDEFVRLRDLVRPFVPARVQLIPGTTFGPLRGTSAGTFGTFLFQNPGELLVHREALERLQAEGLRGLSGYRTELRFRQKKPPEMLEMEIIPHGRLHPDCFLPDRPNPCARCGRMGLSLPEQPVLERASLPDDLDLFRLATFETVLVCTERFRDAVLRLELDGLEFRELPLR